MKKIKNFFMVLLVVVCSLQLFALKTVEPTAAQMQVAPVEPKEPFTLNGEVYSFCGETESGVFLYSTGEEEIPKHIIEVIEGAEVKNSMTEFEKCDAISEYLSQILEYDPRVKRFRDELYPWFTDWSILNGKAVCAGYTDAFQTICTALGIECWYEVGHTFEQDGSQGELHAWNRVVVDGTNYWYDVTWFDASKEPTYLQCYKRWNDRVLEEEWFRYRINGSMFEMPTSEIVPNVEN